MPASWCCLSLALLCEDTVKRQPSASQEDRSHQELKQANTLIVDFPASRTEKTNSFCFKLPSLCYFVMAVTKQTKQTSINLKGEKSCKVWPLTTMK